MNLSYGDGLNPTRESGDSCSILFLVLPPSLTQWFHTGSQTIVSVETSHWNSVIFEDSLLIANLHTLQKMDKFLADERRYFHL